ncbi:class I SAM-dependent methyltransferase [Azospirillum sp. RWY-5-1]|uniref:Class I SAM-dependent methyltransferase n=1 Tax=Azospirillum oleiclasticum TaxID=2735135 RepID=A0ABX2TK46_9PROT|nr:class I SAM-dependent methyltransferase [Azospirillum oleiclasticum]NYZ16219.1 class I SAM-dependent methyltransferase [Azospirillum oleiclasticum]NYZ23706.1 class I SAM-dependent methyltransferase [Azospirillum oleiclasticum]
MTTAAPTAVPRTLTLKQALAEVVEVGGRVVVDVGCGDGALVRHLAGLGATVTGIEISDGQLARARAAEPVDGAGYAVGSGEALPMADGSTDVVVYSNSFHHLPLAVMAPSLAEAARVLKPGGRLVVVEPVADGAYFAVTRRLDDETVVRAAAHDTLRRPPPELEPVDETVYHTVMRYRDADHLLTHMVAVDPDRRARLPAVEAEMRDGFAAAARWTDGMAEFDQPMRRMVFVRR